MLRFLRIQVKNWVVYEDVEFSFSKDPDRNLTVIRAENGVGKTVLLRAIRWALYGDETFQELDRPESPYLVSPVWVKEGPIESSVKIEFETDLVARDAMDTGQGRLETYILNRSLSTRGSDETELTRGPSNLTLFRRDTDGELVREAESDLLISKMLPPSLSDLFVMDADRAAEYTGGAEGRTVDPLDAETRTTRAISNLLGLELVEDAMKRMAELARGYRRDATLAIDDDEMTRMQTELNDLVEQIEQAEKGVRQETEKRADLKTQIKTRHEELNRELRDSGSYEQLEKRKTENEETLRILRKDRGRLRTNLSNLLDDMNLLTALCRSDIEKVSRELLPLYQEGTIPQQHLNFVKKLLERGACVCGQDLSEAGPQRTSVEKSIEQAQGNESGADFLGNAWEVASGLEEGLSEGLENWIDEKEDYSLELGEVETDLRDQNAERGKINETLEKIDEGRISFLNNQIDTLGTQLETATVRIAKHEESLAQLKPNKDHLDHVLAQKARNRREADDHMKREMLANTTFEVLKHAYGQVREEQVTELSALTDRIFHQIVHDESWGEVEGSDQEDTLGLQNIKKIGVRSVADRPEKYEIYAKNVRDSDMSMQQINGASRRVVALSFVLALCEESDTWAPLVGDSLLNTMSGSVAESTVTLSARHTSQAILLLTPKDLGGGLGEYLSSHEESPMGASYTITSMDQVGTKKWKVVRKRDGKDHRTLQCGCSPVEYCDTCERNGQPQSWTRRG